MQGFALLVAFCLVAVSLVNADCYYPNGTNANNLPGGVKYEECPGLPGSHGMCCYESGDQRCKDNGLCYYADGALLWRQLCTDSTWQSEGCVKLCLNGERIFSLDRTETTY